MQFIRNFADKLTNLLPRSYTPILLFFFGVCLTLETSYFLIMVLDERQEVLFNNAVIRTESIIGDYVNLYGVMLRSTKGLLVVDTNTTQSEFETFVEQLQLAERFPGIVGVGYTMAFTPAELPSMPARMRSLGVQDWELFPVGTRDQYHSIIFLGSNAETRQHIVGYDMFTEPKRRAAMEQARDTGSLVMTGNIALSQPDGQPPVRGFIMYLPVYDPGNVPTTRQERQASLAGFIYAPFRASDFFESVFKSELTPPLVDVAVYDGTEAELSQLLYSSRTTENDSYKPKHTATRELEIAGHTWTVVYTNKPEFEVFARSEFVGFLLAGGLMSSFLLFIVSKKQVDARTAAERSQQRLLESQAELRESEERFRLLVEGAQDYAIIYLDPQGRITSWNKGAENMFQYQEEEILGQEFTIFFSEEDNQRGLSDRELHRVLSTGHSEDENWLVRKDGTYFWASGSSTAVYGTDGSLLGIAKIARDLSLRKKTEEVLRKNEALTQAVLQSLPAFIAVLDQKGKIIAINEAGNGEASLRTEFLKMVQIRKNYLDLIKHYTQVPIAVRRKIMAGVQAVLADKKSEFKFEFSLKKEEVQVWILLQVTPLKYAGSGVVVSHTDITERKNLETQKDEFISIASHELKTPITSIKAYIQVLAKLVQAMPSDRFQKIVGRVDKQIDKLTTLVSDLLDVSKVESGQLKFNYDIFSFDELVEEVIESIQYTTQSHKIKLHGRTNVKLYADRERVNQVMVNLLSNAIKYSPDADTVQVTIGKEQHDKKQYVKYCVADYGVGIPKHQQKRIFDRFYRASASTSFAGLGLGLYISAQIIRRLGGKIWVESAKGKGSEFSFILPIKAAAKAS